MGVRLYVLGNNHNPRRILIEAVDDTCAWKATGSISPAASVVVGKGMNQSPILISRPRMHSKPRWLVYHYEIVILIQHIQRVFVGGKCIPSWCFKNDPDGVFGRYQSPGLENKLLVNANRTLLDILLNLGPRIVGKLTTSSKQTVENAI
jgi:hypothetical protein